MIILQFFSSSPANTASVDQTFDTYQDAEGSYGLFQYGNNRFTTTIDTTGDSSAVWHRNATTGGRLFEDNVSIDNSLETTHTERSGGMSAVLIEDGTSTLSLEDSREEPTGARSHSYTIGNDDNHHYELVKYESETFTSDETRTREVYSLESSLYSSGFSLTVQVPSVPAGVIDDDVGPAGAAAPLADIGENLFMNAVAPANVGMVAEKPDLVEHARRLVRRAHPRAYFHRVGDGRNVFRHGLAGCLPLQGGGSALAMPVFGACLTFT